MYVGNIDMASIRQALSRMGEGFAQIGDAFAQHFGLPTRADREMQRRIERHMARCAMRRERRRKGRA